MSLEFSTAQHFQFSRVTPTSSALPKNIPIWQAKGKHVLQLDSEPLGTDGAGHKHPFRRFGAVAHSVLCSIFFTTDFRGKQVRPKPAFCIIFAAVLFSVHAYIGYSYLPFGCSIQQDRLDTHSPLTRVYTCKQLDYPTVLFKHGVVPWPNAPWAQVLGSAAHVYAAYSYYSDPSAGQTRNLRQAEPYASAPL